MEHNETVGTAFPVPWRETTCGENALDRQPGAGPGSGSGPATSADVARLAGVSRATVSLILNDQIARFNPDTVRRVRACASALGYVRSAAGRALVRGHSDFVVLVVPYTTFLKLQEVVETLSADFDELGFSVVVHFSVPAVAGGMPGRLEYLVKALRPAGVVDLGGLTREDLAFLETAGCPVMPRRGPEYSDYNGSIGDLQAEHLHSRGYTRLAYAFLSDVRDDPYGTGREEAVARFCAARGLPPPASIHVAIEAEGAARALGGLVAARGRPVGIACYNDEVALALVFAARRLGLAVPGDVAVVGAESGAIGQAVSPRLTTVVSDVSAVLRHIRQSMAQAYERLAPLDRVPAPGEAHTLLKGETT
jgi:DNA-binding LacI/PurR family transcriptional regulator